MVKKAKKSTAALRKDKFYKLAKEQGYRARSSFKLVQLNRTYDFLSNASVCVDLCAAPGGWCQVAKKYMPVSSLIVGVDLVPIRGIPGVVLLQEDITTNKCVQSIRNSLKGAQADVFLNDGAPNVGANWVKDAYSQSELVLYGVKLATKFLRKGGVLVSKIFRSRDYFALLWVLQQLFRRVESTKPAASRQVSAEIYVICQGYLAPTTIDPKMLDPKVVFGELGDPEKSLGFMELVKSKQKRFREGYSETIPVTMHRNIDAVEFVNSETPVNMLADFNSIVFTSDESKKFLRQLKTTDDVKSGCADLRVLNQKDFKILLKWRMDMKAVLEGKVESFTDKTEELKEDGEDEIQRLLEEIKAKETSVRKRKKRKARKELSKYQQRVAMDMENPGIDVGDDPTLFAARKGLDKALEPIEMNTEIESSSESSSESESEGSDYKATLESSLGLLYDQYLERRKTRKSTDVPTVSALYESIDMPVTDKLAAITSDPLASEPTQLHEDVLDTVSFNSEDECEEMEEDAPSAGHSSAKAQVWFASEEFADLAKDPETANALEGIVALPSDFDVGRIDNEGQKDDSDDAFEEVPMDDTESDTDSESEAGSSESEIEKDEGLDDTELVERSKESKDTRSVVLAMGKYTVNKKSKSKILDNSYNRYAWNDEGLPVWFAAEEKAHRRPQLPVTAEMIAEANQRMIAINARPMKKVAEAKGRKKQKTARKLRRLQQRASEVVASGDLDAGQKAAAIERLASAAAYSPRPKRQVTVAKKFKTGGAVKGKRRVVDPRMRKDERAQKQRDKRGKKRKR